MITVSVLSAVQRRKHHHRKRDRSIVRFSNRRVGAAVSRNVSTCTSVLLAESGLLDRNALRERLVSVRESRREVASIIRIILAFLAISSHNKAANSPYTQSESGMHHGAFNGRAVDDMKRGYRDYSPGS